MMLKFRLADVAALSVVAGSPSAAQPAAQPAVQAIALWSYGYSPRPIHLRAGQPVRLVFVNRSGNGHDFTARDFFARSRILSGDVRGGKIELGAGQTRTVTLVPAAGSYAVYCSHFLHRTFGMRDTIVVN
jgi:plastocyanin